MDSPFPYFIDWAITAKCNLKCRHCRGMSGSDLSTDRVKRLVGEIAKLKPAWVIVEGGEPLLRDDIFELLKLMREKGLEVHLITNGMLLEAHTMPVLKDLNIRVMVSIDGATQATYEAIRGGADFATVCASARSYAAEGLLEAVNFTIMKDNYREIAGVFELAKRVGAPMVTFIGLKPCHEYQGALLSPQEYEIAIKLACEGSQKSGIEFYFDEPFFWSAVKQWGLAVQMPAVGTGILVPSNSACIFGEYLFIDTNGDVKPCSYSPMTLGSVRDKTLGEIWSEVVSSPFFQRIKDPKSRTGVCRTCQYLADCRGCRSRTYVLTGDWFAPDPCCPLSLKIAIKKER